MRVRSGLAVLCTAAAYVSAAAPGPQVVFKTCKAVATAHGGRASPLPSSPVIPRPVRPVASSSNATAGNAGRASLVDSLHATVIYWVRAVSKT